VRNGPVVRVVLDTNILLRMVMTSPTSLAGKVHRALKEGDFTLVLSPLLLQEITDTLCSSDLSARHPLGEEVIARYTRHLTAMASITKGSLTLNIPALHQRDPDDVMVLSAAVEGKASFLVTQDKDLLVLGSWLGVRIMELPEFYQVLQLLRGVG